MYRRSHCRNGHPFDEANTIIRRDAKGWSKGLKCRTCMEIYTVNQQDLKPFDWKRIESGNYISKVHPFRTFRSSNKWYLEVNKKVVKHYKYGVNVEQAFETREQAWVAAVILLRLETWKRQHPMPIKYSFDWKRIESGNYISRVPHFYVQGHRRTVHLEGRRFDSFRAFRSGDKWYLEVNGNVVEGVFDTRRRAWSEAQMLFKNMETSKQYA